LEVSGLFLRCVQSERSEDGGLGACPHVLHGKWKRGD
jgi:hypothetical protein